METLKILVVLLITTGPAVEGKLGRVHVMVRILTPQALYIIGVSGACNAQSIMFKSFIKIPRWGS